MRYRRLCTVACVFILAITGCEEDGDTIVWEEIPTAQEADVEGALTAGIGVSGSGTDVAGMGTYGLTESLAEEAGAADGRGKASGAGEAGAANSGSAGYGTDRSVTGLSGAGLSGTGLSGTGLSGASLSGAGLSGAGLHATASSAGSSSGEGQSGTGRSLVDSSQEKVSKSAEQALTWGTTQELPEDPGIAPGLLEGGPGQEIAAGKELLCLADSREEAESIAEQYGIALVEFSYGVATFHTTEDPREVIRRGQQNGWEPLDLNQIIYLDGER